MPLRPNEKHLKIFARWGYAARGVVYLLVGLFALLAALGNGGARDTHGALRALLAQPLGETLLAAIAVGLLGYALWRFLQAVFDADRHGHDLRGLTVRAALLVSASTHLLLALWAGRTALGQATGGGTHDWTAAALDHPLGRAGFAIAGLLIIGAGVGQGAKALSESFRRHLRWSQTTARWACPLSKVGLLARGAVFAIVGGLLIVAAAQSDASSAGGLGEALQTLQRQPLGPWLLGVVATGLAAFGIYSFIEAAYRRVRVPEQELREAARRLDA